MRTLEVTVKPNAPKTEILAASENSLTVAVAGKPEGGEANRKLLKFLSKHFSAEVRIIRGVTGKKKTLLVG